MIDGTLSYFIEQNTARQSECQLWRILHNGRPTSSIVGEIFHGRDSTNPDSIVRCSMGYTQRRAKIFAIQWGKENESFARDAYVTKMRSVGHKEFKMHMAGLTLLPCHSYLRAASDKVIVNHHYPKDNGIIEI